MAEGETRIRLCAAPLRFVIENLAETNFWPSLLEADLDHAVLDAAPHLRHILCSEEPVITNRART